MVMFEEDDYRSLTGFFFVSDSKYIESMKKHICEILYIVENQHITDENLR